MVKVTGGGGSVGGVAAHLAYISHEGEHDLETDDGQRVSKQGQKELLKDWHLELMSGQYRKPPGAKGRRVKLVHNIVLSMPAPTPADKVLAAAKSFAREKFALKHRYAMALHTHQQHPHVHLVVKAEDEHGRRLHIDKALLREWRQDFARMMREQGIAANATVRAIRGQNRRSARDARYRSQRHGTSYALLERIKTVIEELSKTGTVSDPARTKLQQTRQAVLSGWKGIADRLDAQGEISLAGDVRYFARHLPPVLTDRERLAQQLLSHARTGAPRDRDRDLTREREMERTR
jgi:transcriptional regulator of met regulon